MRAGTAGSDTERGQLVERGLVLIDEALARAGKPGRTASDREVASAETRLLAAGAFIAMPDEAFHRFDQGRALLEAELAGPCFDRLPPRLRGHIHYQASLAARHLGSAAEERSQLRAYAAVAPPDDPIAQVVRARLDQLER